jgi:Fe-S-cluster containining protein
VADAALVALAVGRLEPNVRAGVLARAEAQVALMNRLQPSWGAPYDVAAIGEARFDQLTDDLAGEPCPALDEQGACTIYQHRPFVCRVMGLGMVVESGDVIDNACPIQDQYSAYRAIPPEPFQLEAFETGEEDAKVAAALALFGDESRGTYETTIAAAITTWRESEPADSL